MFTPLSRGIVPEQVEVEVLLELVVVGCAVDVLLEVELVLLELEVVLPGRHWL